MIKSLTVPFTLILTVLPTAFAPNLTFAIKIHLLAQNSILDRSAFHTPVTVKPSRDSKVTENGFAVTSVAIFN
jgi:hypothetical protein